jgi:EmrB/QacA subfamily drug resistance transporter
MTEGLALGTSSRGATRSSFGFTALLAILFLTFLDNTVISAVLANVQAQLHSGVTDLQWIVGGYALVFASLMLMCGSLGDAFGRKKMMLLGVAVFAGGSVMCAVSTSSMMLIIGRMIMGAGAAASEPGTLSMIRQIYHDPRQRARALGAWAAVTGLALAIGPVLGGVLNGVWSWRAIFWFNVILAGVAFVIAWRSLPESTDLSRARPDYVGFVLGAFTLGALTYATITGETAGYRSGGVVTLYVVSGLALLAFLVVESRVAQPMLPLRFFARPSFGGATFVALTSYFSILSIFFFVALYMEIVVSASAYQLAQAFLPLLVGMVAASLVSGRWVGAVGPRIPMTAGCLLAATGVMLTDQIIGPHVRMMSLGWAMGLAGVGFGILVVPVTAAALASLPPANSGVAASVTNTSRELGAVAGVAILGSVVNGQLTVHLTQRLVQLGIPEAYRAQVITAVTTGQVDAEVKGLGHLSASVKQIVDTVVAAAYQAFTHGVELALGASVVLLVISAVVAYSTGSSEPVDELI